MKNLPLLVGSLVMTLLVVVGISILFTKKATAPTTAQVVDAKSLMGDSRHTRGPNNAPVTLVEFGDFQCPACKATEPLVSQIDKDNPGKIKFVFRSFPLRSVHERADEGARAAEAATLQNQFWSYHDVLYAQQDDWSTQKDPYAKFEQYAKQLKMDVVKFKKDYQDSKLETLINNDERDGLIIGVNATPTFYVNGVKTDISNLAQAVSQAAAAK